MLRSAHISRTKFSLAIVQLDYRPLGDGGLIKLLVTFPCHDDLRSMRLWESAHPH